MGNKLLAQSAEIVGTAEAAKILGLNVSRVKRLAKDGRIGKAVAGRYLFTKTELQKFSETPRPPGRKPRKTRALRNAKKSIPAS